MTKEDDDFLKLVQGKDPQPEETRKHFTFGKDFHGFTNAGTIRTLSGTAALFMHPSGRGFVEVFPPESESIPMLQRALEQGISKRALRERH